MEHPVHVARVLAANIEVLHGHCADIGRDPGEITITAQCIHDPAVGAAATAEACAELGDAGCELAVVYLPESHHHAAEVERLADALALTLPVGGAAVV